MPQGSTRDVLRHLTALCRSGVLSTLDDEQLLERFIELSDDGAQEAFAMLMRRHGPMVLGVCSRVLRDSHEAEDAFQATFLVLARKATSVIPREKVANWLYGVAYRTAHEARVRATRRRAREERVGTRLRLERLDEARHDELRAILDDELSSLPARYRGPIVLCELEGLTRQEAAQRLGVPEGTVSSRLARAKARLRDRLTRRGVTLAAGAISLIAIREASAIALCESLIESTTLAAMRVAAGISATAVISTSVVSLTEGVLKSMLLTKLKGIAFVIGSSVVVISGAVALGQTALPAGSTITQSGAERMSVMERKLDRIIDALDRLAGASNGNIVGQGAASQDMLSTVKSDDGTAHAKSVPSDYSRRDENTSSYQAKNRNSANSLRLSTDFQQRPLQDRVEAVERGLESVQQLVAQLAGRVSELETAGQGAYRAIGDTKKP